MRPPVRAWRKNRPGRRLSLRTLLVILAVVPSMALVGLWGFTATRLWSDTNELKDQNDIANRAGMPAYTVMVQLQEERRLSASWLAAPDETVRKALAAQRVRTDGALAEFTRLMRGLRDTRADVVERAGRIEANRQALPNTRDLVDRRTGARGDLLKPYGLAIENQLETFTTLSHIDTDGHLTWRSLSLVAMFRATEMIAREDALLTYVAAAKRLDPGEYIEFAQTVGARRDLYDNQIVPELEPEHLAGYQQLAKTQPWQTMLRVEDAMLAAPRGTASAGGYPIPAELAGWRGAMDQLVEPVTKFNTGRAGDIVNASETRVDDLETTVWFITGSGLGVVVIVSVLCYGVTRTLRKRLRDLQDATTELAEERLPGVIDRLSRGERVDTTAELPALPHSRDEIGKVAHAFETAQRAAMDGAVRLAREREGHAKVFHNVALRTQSLVGRQLRALDAMETRHQDPDVLGDLFALDHLATRLRRYEENLVILSGHQPGRRWSKPVRVVDIVRSAVGEVEDYERIDVHMSSELLLEGAAVGAVIHLLAELLENATTFSPPRTPVEVRGMPVAKGLVVEIEDRGLGMAEDDYAALNTELEQPRAFDMVALAEDVRLGLFVVARLAERHGIGVTLRASPYGGTLAIVFLPEELIVRPGEEGAGDGRSSDADAGEDAADAPEAVGTAEASGEEEPLAEPVPITSAVGRKQAAGRGGAHADATEAGGDAEADRGPATPGTEATPGVSPQGKDRLRRLWSRERAATGAEDAGTARDDAGAEATGPAGATPDTAPEATGAGAGTGATATPGAGTTAARDGATAPGRGTAPQAPDGSGEPASPGTDAAGLADHAASPTDAGDTAPGRPAGATTSTTDGERVSASDHEGGTEPGPEDAGNGRAPLPSRRRVNAAANGSPAPNGNGHRGHGDGSGDDSGPSGSGNGSAARTAAAPSGDTPSGDDDAAPDGPRILPRRVRQASLAAPLRRAPEDGAAEDADATPARRPPATPQQAADTISAFQRASQRARNAELPTEPPTRDRS